MNVPSFSPSTFPSLLQSVMMTCMIMLVLMSAPTVLVHGIPSCEIPRETSFNDATGDCGRTEFPGYRLSECTDPLEDGVFDSRGWWQHTTLPTILLIEQCGNRFVLSQNQLDYQGRWTARDYPETDGITPYLIYFGRAFPDCVPLYVTIRYEDNCRIVESPNLNATYCKIAEDVMTWEYYAFGESLSDTLIRLPDGPRVSTGLVNAATNQRLGEFPTATFNPDGGVLGSTIDLCQVGAIPLTIQAIAPGATKMKLRLVNATDCTTVTKTVEKVEPFMLGGDINGPPYQSLPVDALKVPGVYKLIINPSPGFSKIERNFEVKACGM